uniref:SRCR domain-containing protein n=1 Tax=Sander lucioperca TaxID=283035 RepID=A0A8D0A8P2_SANLU
RLLFLHPVSQLLVNGTSMCSGRLEVKTNQSTQRWSSVCEDVFDQQDAEVVCRELGCGAPLVLQGALYGEVEAPMWTKEFQCGGRESALLDCRSSGSDRNTCSPGKDVGLTCSEPVRLVGGASRCAGTLELEQGEWRPVSYITVDYYSDWNLKTAAAACRELDCGSAVSVEERQESSVRSVWRIRSDCVESGSTLRKFCSFVPCPSCYSVRLVNGTSLCSGRLEVKTNQSNQRWSSVCEDDFDQQDAEVVCRELGCGPPSVLQGALYGEVEPPMRTKEFQCGGQESALLDYRSSGSDRNTCSPGKAVGLTCSGRRGAAPDAVRLVGGASRCAGTLELQYHRYWRPVGGYYYPGWNLKKADAVCRELNCGSAVSVEERQESSVRSVWRIRSECVRYGYALRKCATSDSSSSILDLTCSGKPMVTSSMTVMYPVQFESLNCCFLASFYSVWCLFSFSIVSSIISPDSVRLMNGTSLCSGRLEVKTNQSTQRWSSVCEDDFDQQDAEVVCRELGCGPPSVLQGVLYGEVEPPMRSKEFQCGGHESALLDCRSSVSDRNTCSPGKAVGLTCSEPVRLVGGSSHCAGILEVKQGEWRPMVVYPWTLMTAAAACRELDCGSAVSVEERKESSHRSVWRMRSNCVQSGSALRDCAESRYSAYIQDLTSMKHAPRYISVDMNYTPRYKSVCMKHICCFRSPLGQPVTSLTGLLQLHSFLSEPLFESLNCCFLTSFNLVSGVVSLSMLSSIISPDSVRLVNGTSLCSGRLEVKTNQSTQRWSSVCEDDFDQQDAEVVCRELGCGPPSILQGVLYGEVEPPMRSKEFQCGGHESALMDCRSSGSDRNTCSPGKVVGLTCSEPVRLVGGSSHCAGTLEVKQGEWRPMVVYPWTLKTAAAVCRELDCGSAVSVEERKESSHRSVWRMRSNCVQSGSALRDCAESRYSAYIQDLTCSGKSISESSMTSCMTVMYPVCQTHAACSKMENNNSVRLVNGTSLCSGRLEVKTNQSTQHWSSVCEDDFDQQDAEVVCRELGCGAPSVLQGALYGEVEPPMWTKEFQCGGNESALLDCRSSVSDRNTCSPGKAVGVTCSGRRGAAALIWFISVLMKLTLFFHAGFCSEPVRLVGGAIHCAGTLEVKQGEWRPMVVYPWTLKTAAAVCRELDCGSAVSVEERKESSDRSVWRMRSNCVQSGSALRECAESHYSAYIQDFTCSGKPISESSMTSCMTVMYPC